MIDYATNNASIEANGRSLPVLFILLRIAQKFSKKYCYPNHETIRWYLLKDYHLDISPRTLCRYMADLEGTGLIHRQRRHQRDKHGSLVLHSTLYTFSKRACRWVSRITRSTMQLIDSSAVPKMADNLRTTIDLPPTATANGAVDSSEVRRRGVAGLREALR